MIIGNNNLFKKSNFIKNQPQNNYIKEKTQIDNHNKTIINDNTNLDYSKKIINIQDKNDIKNKSILMLEQRLKNGTITIEEFNKKCIELGKNCK